MSCEADEIAIIKPIKTIRAKLSMGLRMLQKISDNKIMNCNDMIQAFLCPIKDVRTGILIRSIKGAHKKLIA